MVYTSQKITGQDRWVQEEVLNRKSNGFFIEAGAGDGVNNSNTLALESQFGWSGICVEPHPYRFAKLKESRKCVCENLCLAEESKQVEFTINHSIPGTSGITTSLSDGIRKAFYHPEVKTEPVVMPAVTFGELLRRHNAPKVIDYLSLDLEGGEYNALKVFPFDEYTIQCLTIERGSSDYGKLTRLLESKGYRLVKIVKHDDFWVHESVPYRPGLPARLSTWAKRLGQMLKHTRPG